MHDKRTEREQRMFDALRKIAKGYMTPGQLRKKSEKLYGLEYIEALEFTYENVQAEAAEAIRGMRRPPVAVPPAPPHGRRRA